MATIELGWNDMPAIPTDCVRPWLLALEGGTLEDVVVTAAAVRDAAEAVVVGRAEG